jgi:PKD repeat protein
MLNLFKTRWAAAVMVAALAISSCNEDDDKEPPLLIKAKFTVELDDLTPTTAHFTNTSIGAKTYSWDFGDDSQPSSEANPSHNYTAAGTYTVQLTATADDGRTSKYSADVTIADPLIQLKKLTGTTSKTWKLLRELTLGGFPIQVGPQGFASTYWAFGKDTKLSDRPCALNDEYTFNINGTFTYDAKGDVFADAGQFGPWSDDIGSICTDATDENFIGKEGVDISAWNSGAHTFTYNTASSELTVSGLGAFIGIQKVGTTGEVSVPQESVTYKVVSLTDGDVDKLVLDAIHSSGNAWRIVLVHYDDPADEPAIPGEEEPNEDCIADEAESISGAAGILLSLESVDSQMGGFGGVTGGSIANPYVTGINTSCYVNQYDRSTAGCETWGGAAILLSDAIDFGSTTKKKFKLKVYAETKVADVVLRLERLPYPDVDPAEERTATITATGEWQELTFDFSGVTDPNTYKNIVIYFDRGNCAEAVKFFFDDLKQVE